MVTCLVLRFTLSSARGRVTPSGWGRPKWPFRALPQRSVGWAELSAWAFPEWGSPGKPSYHTNPSAHTHQSYLWPNSKRYLMKTPRERHNGTVTAGQTSFCRPFVFGTLWDSHATSSVGFTDLNPTPRGLSLYIIYVVFDICLVGKIFSQISVLFFSIL